MSPNKFPGIIFIAVSFALAWVVVGLVTYFGLPTNSLHTSAQSWAFVLILAVLAGYGLGSISALWSTRDGG
jgi:hypothetical protein